MNKLLILLSLSTGCMTMTHHIVTQSDCAPAAFPLMDVAGSALVTTTGIIEHKPVLVAIGTTMLVGSAINWVQQMASCHHLH